MKGEKEPTIIKELHFGDVYLSRPDGVGKQWKFVIVDVGSEEEGKNFGKKGILFHAGSVNNETEGEEIIGAVGTIEIKDIVKIVDRWPVEKVVQAMVRFWSGMTSEKERADYMEGIRERAKKPHRVLSKSND